MNAQEILAAIKATTFTPVELSSIYIALHDKMEVVPRILTHAEFTKPRVMPSAGFAYGMRVSFGRPNGRKQTGVIRKLNEKTAKVLCDTDGKVWNVSYPLMQKL